MKTKGWTFIVVGIILSAIGFSDPALWPWILFNILGGCFCGTGIAMIQRG